VFRVAYRNGITLSSHRFWNHVHCLRHSPLSPTTHCTFSLSIRHDPEIIQQGRILGRFHFHDERLYKKLNEKPMQLLVNVLITCQR